MSRLVIAIVFIFSVVASADHHEEMKGGKFEDHKAKILKKIDQRMAGLKEHKSCVTAAKDKAGLKECRKKMKDSRSQWMEPHKGSRMGKDKKKDK